ncbi:unnamed protein product [Rhizoctonia solani]|uniref:Zn(2)-C6 fungal-type domain-containing protein n=1 Tax=Rhizoctonia solani TaxID=456999 RepID=A0A8H3AQJ1_9AGAM|nr:unnamed protein product [Rhizoctonia solani]
MATRRSTTGCTPCKRGRRKCDESKPLCQRCISSGKPCSYEYVEHPNPMPHLILRTKPAPRLLSKAPDIASRDTLVALEAGAVSLSTQLASGDPTMSNDFVPTTTQRNNAALDFNLTTYSGCTVDPLLLFNIPPFSEPLLSHIDSPYITPSSTQAVAGISHDITTQTAGSQPGPKELAWSDSFESELSEDYDPEGIQVLFLVTPTMDKNVKENALPFVLQCYSQWALVCVFDPLKIVHMMRERAVEQFSSEDTRTRSILMANVMGMFAKNLLLDNAGMSIVTYLVSEVQESVKSFMTKPPSSVPALYRQYAMRTLDNTLEMMTLQVNTQPLVACIQSVEDAAPVFRRACPEPPDQPLNLANILLEPGLNLRHFVCADIMMCVTTGRPTHFKYTVAYSTELCERMFQLQENYGLQWLHGLPDQFVMIFAWINSLCEIPGANTDPKWFHRIETEILQAKVVLDQSNDPILRLGRMVVREGWRNAALIYLYCVLCGADASDSRVVRALRNFMRLINGTKPGRNPDTYLANPMIIVGVAACKERDRHTIRQRILNVPECSIPGTAGYDAVRVLEDIWTRTKNEGRAAVWSDLRIACLRVTGK